MSEWRTVKLSDLGSVITGKTPPGNDPIYFGGDVDFLTPSDMVNGHRTPKVERTISSFGVQKFNKLLIHKGVGVSCIGWQMGKSVLIERQTITNQQINSILVNEQVADPLFVYYSLTSRRNELFNLGAGGSRTPILNKGNFEQLPFLCPPLPEQKAIASILSSLDDKIELNRRMNETLEEMARAIFKDWFVDFGPTRAKIEGRAPYLSEHLWALFPEAINVETGLPQGWEISPFESIVSVKDGTHDSPKMSAFGYPLITSKHLKDGYIDFDSAYLISEKDFLEVNKRSKVDRLDILITMIGTVGNLFFVDYKSIDFAIKNVGLFKTSEKPYLAEYLYLFLESSSITNYLKSRQSGTTQSYLTLKSLRTIPVVLPNVELVEAFKANVNSVFERITLNRDESCTLAELRDRLLPKLMSGEIRVKDAEKLAEDAV